MDPSELFGTWHLQDHITGLLVQNLVDQGVISWRIQNHFDFVFRNREWRGNVSWFGDFYLTVGS